MENANPKPLPAANPVTQATHRQQSWLQIYLPMIVITLITMALGVLSTLKTNTQIAHWGNISSIIVIIPVLIILLINLIIIIGMVYGLMRLLQILPGYTNLAQIMMKNIQSKLHQVADLSVQPFISMGSYWAAVKRIFNQK